MSVIQEAALQEKTTVRTKTSGSLAEALRYPFQGQGWFQRIGRLALVQLIPVVGQLILSGYGLEVVRAIYAGEVDLPPLRWRVALRGGALMFGLSLIFFTPVLMLVPNYVMLEAGLRWLNLDPVPGSAGDIGIQVVISGLLALLIFCIVVGIHISGVHYAVDRSRLRKLLSPTALPRLLWQQRGTTGPLMLNLLALLLLGALAVATGLVLLIVPGLYALVIVSIALWYLFARAGMALGIGMG